MHRVELGDHVADGMATLIRHTSWSLLMMRGTLISMLAPHKDMVYTVQYWMDKGMITAAQLRAARALLDLDQRMLAELSGLSVPTIQRMEASEGVVRGTVDSLMKLVRALDTAGIELISEGAVSAGGGRGIRLKERAAAIGD